MPRGRTKKRNVYKSQWSIVSIVKNFIWLSILTTTQMQTFWIHVSYPTISRFDIFGTGWAHGKLFYLAHTRTRIAHSDNSGPCFTIGDKKCYTNRIFESVKKRKIREKTTDDNSFSACCGAEIYCRLQLPFSTYFGSSSSQMLPPYCTVIISTGTIRNMSLWR